jgi:CDGSH-type Zn-finger protein/uncharacterized Fe-S cluster protein YjdI
MKDRKIHKYESDAIKVTYDPGRCIHAGECVRGLNEVFNTGLKPWIQPGKSDAASIAEVIHRCPTGALHYERYDGGDNEGTPSENTLELRPSGPVYARGNLIVRDSEGNELHRDTRIAFCRCGLSKDKPFCDNSHKNNFTAGVSFDKEKFRDAPVSSEEDVLELKLQKNGPILVKGTYKLIGSDHQISAKGIALCRCGLSASKPFCDGSHKKSDFTT